MTELLLSAPVVDSVLAGATEPIVTIGASAPAAASSAANMGIGGAAVTALLGYSVVFFGLVLLMGVIALFGKLMAGKKASAPAAAPATAAPATAAPAAAPVAEKKPDIGVRDGVRVCDLNGVDDKTAAMIMAIVADKTGIPLNELRFISIKEL